MEILRKNSASNETTRSLFYSSKEIYAHSLITVPGFESGPKEFVAGEHNFAFAILLDQILPSSFKGSHGSIKYKMTIIISRPWAFDDRHSLPLIIIKNMPLPPYYRLNPTPLEKQITKTINLFGAKPITMLAMLPEDYAVCGDALQICVKVTNNSTTTVEKLKFTVLQHIVYYSHIPLRVQRRETNAIVNKETGSVHKKSERSFAHELIIPMRTQPSDDEYSGVINISYELRVEGVLRGFYKNLVLHMPFKLFSSDVAFRISPDAPSTSSSCTLRGTAGGNPFESNSSSANYSSMDSNLASPSHSSECSEYSSVHSTTSDSSAATLSPANMGAAAAAPSYDESSQSSGTSQLNSPCNRSSIRSSQCYQALSNSNSPAMTNSHIAAAPTTPTAETPTLPAANSTPMSNSGNTNRLSLTNNLGSSSNQTASASSSAAARPSTSRASTSSFNFSLSPNTSSASAFLHRMLHPEVHELRKWKLQLSHSIKIK